MAKKINNKLLTLNQKYRNVETDTARLYQLLNPLPISMESKNIVWDWYQYRGVSVPSIEKLKYRIIVMEDKFSPVTNIYREGKLVGLERMFSIISGFTKAQQFVYLEMIRPKTVAEKDTGLKQHGIKSKKASDYWRNNYKPGRNLTQDEKNLVNKDFPLENPYYPDEE